MTQLFGIPLDTLTTILILIAATIVVVVLLFALANRIFFKVGVRNIPRRRLQMVLIVFALMLSTTLLSSVLATGDVITAAVQSVAVYNYGNVDELIEGGHGDLGTYADAVYYTLRYERDHNSSIAALGAALREPNLLVADETSRQVRSKVTALGIIPGSEQGFGGMLDAVTKKHLTIANLHPNQVYLNQTVAQLLNAKAGDTLYLYSQRWPGQRYAMRVMAIVQNGGLVGDNPFLLSNIQTFHAIEGNDDIINQVYIANRGGGGVAGIDLSNSVTAAVSRQLPYDVHILQVKQQGVNNSQKAQDIFSRIFDLFSLFALAIGLLLIFLIFILLAAERRAEMGMARAIGVQRRHLVLMFLFEGAVYDVLSSLIGVAAGIGIGALLVYFLGPILARFDFPLKLTFRPRSLIIAYCLGVIFTFCSVAISSWLVSRMTVVEAMRDLPEQGQHVLSLRELVLRFLDLLRQLAQSLFQRPTLQFRRTRRILLEHLPETLLGFVRVLVLLGFIPLLAGYWLMQYGLENTLIIPFSLGLSLVTIGAGLLLKSVLVQLYRIGITLAQPRVALAQKQSEAELDRAKRIGDVSRFLNRLFSTCIALALVGYWALPFDVLAQLGLPRFQGSIEVFFVAGVMMVAGTVWVVVINAEFLVSPLLAFCARLPGIYAMTRLASAYPLHRRLRTGLSVIMFSLVVFAMTVMTIITSAMQNSYVDVNTQTGGYDIQATAYFKSLNDINTALAQHGIDKNIFSAIGERNTTVVGVLQPTAAAPRWSIYPAQVVSGGFLQGYGLHLVGRARGFASDADVWQALQTHPEYALIDSSALPYNPNTVDNSGVYDPSSPSANDAGAPATPPNFDPRYTYSVDGLYQGDKSFAAVPVWITGLSVQKAVKETIIGVVDNSDSGHFGLYIPHSAYSNASLATSTNGNVVTNSAGLNNPEAHSYYFKVAPGQDKRAVALALGSAFLDNGLETTVLEDAVWELRGPRILLSDVLLGVVGMTLLLGVAALAITGTRAVIERRQQIGMLRALGCKRSLIQGAFLLESFLVGAIGSILGIVLGVVLARNVFAANFFEQYQTGLTFAVPWEQLGIIVGVALLAAFLGAVLPSWQAGRITPAEALRYQ
jgi:putative ABC transport system permease protein